MQEIVLTLQTSSSVECWLALPLLPRPRQKMKMVDAAANSAAPAESKAGVAKPGVRPLFEAAYSRCPLRLRSVITPGVYPLLSETVKTVFIRPTSGARTTAYLYNTIQVQRVRARLHFSTYNRVLSTILKTESVLVVATLSFVCVPWGTLPTPWGTARQKSARVMMMKRGYRRQRKPPLLLWRYQ